MLDAADADVRLDVLRRGVGEHGSRDDHGPAAAVVGREHRVGVLSLAARHARAPERVGDRPRVDRLDRRLKQVHLFEEERPFLRVEEREPLVDADLDDVALDLREVRVDRRVHDRARVGKPLEVHADLALGDPAVAFISVGAGIHLVGETRRERRDDVVHPLRQALDLLDRRGPAEKAARAPRHLHAVELVVVVARPDSVDHERPVLRILVGVAQRGERDRDLRRPRARADLAGGLPEVVRRVVLAEGRLVQDRVRLDAARADPEVDGGAASVVHVEQDTHVVLLVRDAVAVHERRPDLRHVRLLAPEGRVEELVVPADAGDRLDGRHRAVARLELVEGVDDRRLGPARIRQVAVDRDRTRDPRQGHPRAGPAPRP